MRSWCSPRGPTTHCTARSCACSRGRCGSARCGSRVRSPTDDARLVVWAIALACDYAGPVARPLDAGARALGPERVGARARALRRAADALPDHRAGRDHRGRGRHRLRPRADGRARGVAGGGVRRRRRALVAVLRLPRGAHAAPPAARRGISRPSGARPRLPADPAGRGDHPQRRGERAGDRPPDTLASTATNW